MKLSYLTVAFALFYSAATFASPVIGSPAPAFSLPAASGKTVTLEQYKGKYVVLEWLNHGCPYVRKHYSVGNMQKLQDSYTKKGVVWLSVNSSAEGKQGYTDATAALAEAKQHVSRASEILLDPSGAVGKSYEAKTTPHMFVINPDGVLIYQGAIDDRDSTRPSTVEGATNFVAAALEEAMAGKKVTTSSTEAYGCGIKYAS